MNYVVITDARHPSINPLNWTPIDAVGTSLRGYFTPDNMPFEETVARLITLSGQDPTAQADGYKVSVEFSGRFHGQPFTLYDYKAGYCLHIGGSSALDVAALHDTLSAALIAVTPPPYQAVCKYDESDGQIHYYPPQDADEVLP